MATPRAPKQWRLTTDETINSFENWKQNLMYILSLDNNFAPFLAEGFAWEKKTTANPTRGLADDGDGVPAANRKTAAQKNVQLDLMLGQIANYCAIIARNAIIKGSTSLNDIWQKIRQHYGFQATGAHFLNLADIKTQPGEKPEDLYQRLAAFFEDNLLTTQCGIQHRGAPVDADEDLTPSLENTIVFLWLQLVNPALPQLVKQKYGSELRNKTLASLKPEISLALPSLLEEIRAIEDTKVLRVAQTNTWKSARPQQPFPATNRRRQQKSCVLCKAAGKPTHSTHYISDCKFLPEPDKRAIARSRLVVEFEDETPEIDDYQEDEDTPPSALLDEPSVRRVEVIQSPYLNVYYQHHPVRLTLDTGATTNMIRASLARGIDLPVTPASQMARMADGVTPLDVVGEVHCTFTRGQHTFHLDALVVKQLDVDVLAGNPFCVINDIATRPAMRQVVIGGCDVIYYGPQPRSGASVRRTQAFLVRAPEHQTVVLPGDFVELSTPKCSDPDSVWALEPRFDSKTNQTAKLSTAWPPAQEIHSIGHTLRIPNTAAEPVLLRKHEHVCQVRAISAPQDPASQALPTLPDKVPAPKLPGGPHYRSVSLDPDSILSPSVRRQFQAVNLQHDQVFNPTISKYNGVSGPIEACVNMGPVLPPQRKGRLPHYNRETMIELQNKFDELEEVGVFAKPEQVNVSVEYLNLSFLVKKPKGGSRLVTSFGEVGHYSKPQPSLMPNVDDTLRDIARWKFIVVSDLLQSFYQIPLGHSSMKYCGVSTPFKGIRVYTRSAMGMPGSETCLEELMCRVLGDLIQEGCVAKIADDLYCGGQTPEETLTNWTRVLEALSRNNLRLSASKTIICPKSCSILGWIWSDGTLRASPHRVATLASVTPPPTVQGLRSFIGAYKVLSRVLHGYATLLDPLDQATAGRQSKDKIDWTDELLHAFHLAQDALADNKVITMPRADDCLWIVTDGSVKNRGIAATLYILRKDKLLLAGFYNAKLRKHQVTWLPCEIEALSIGSAVRHFAPYIIQSKHTTQVLTDSKPCIQAHDKLKRGEFSASSRVTTFLSIVSRYQVQLQHIAGAANLPSDYASRSPQLCPTQSCQICKFILEVEDSVVRNLSVKDVMEGSARMPFTSRAAWLATQRECPDLRRTHSYLTQGTRPSKKMTKIPDVKRYLRLLNIASDGLLIVKDDKPFLPTLERMVVPRSVLDGLLTALHLRFTHPSSHQLKQIFNRYFFALDIDNAVQTVSSACHHCASLKSIPQALEPQSSSPPPDRIGSSFAADVMRRYRQCILVLRETVSSYTVCKLISSEKHEELRDALLTLCSELRSLGDGGITIRVDPAPGFVALRADPLLQAQGIQLDIGRVKNPNKNPVAERAIEELGLECLNLSPDGGPLSHVTLALATANMNSRIRKGGLSAREVWTQRDQMSGQQLPIEDRQLLLLQQHARLQNHPASAKSKAHGRPPAPPPPLQVGVLVYLKGDRDKTKARDKYLISSLQGDMCQLRKFTKSQFRSKAYTVKLTDCFPVASTVLSRWPHGPLRGMDDIADSDVELLDHSTPHVPVTKPNASTSLPSNVSPPPPPADIVSLPSPIQPVVSPDTPSGVQPSPPSTPLPSPASTTSTPPTSDPIPGGPDITVATPTSGLASPRRSTRQRKPPAWQRGDAWVLD